jgi:hypothetical protein
VAAAPLEVSWVPTSCLTGSTAGAICFRAWGEIGGAEAYGHMPRSKRPNGYESGRGCA